MRFMALAAVATAALFPGPAAAALLLGATVSEDYRFPDAATPFSGAVYSPRSFVVGAGQESTIEVAGTIFNVDFTDTALTVALDTDLPNTSFTTASFNGLAFTSAAFSQVASISIAPSTNVALDLSRVTRVGNEVQINLSGLTFNTNSVFGLTFTQAVTPVPEPASWTLMITGFGSLAGVVRRGRRKRPSRLQSA